MALPKKTRPGRLPSLSLAEALDQLGRMGIMLRPDIERAELADELSTGEDAPVDRIELLCTLGGEAEQGKGGPFSNDIWHLDAECIVEDGDYVRLAHRFIALTKGQLAITGFRDHVDLEAGEAWFEYQAGNRPERWSLEVSDDWMDPAFYSRFQQLLAARSPHRFMICGLGQDSLILCGDEKKREAISAFSGQQFQWE